MKGCLLLKIFLFIIVFNIIFFSGCIDNKQKLNIEKEREYINQEMKNIVFLSYNEEELSFIENINELIEDREFVKQNNINAKPFTDNTKNISIKTIFPDDFDNELNENINVIVANQEILNDAELINHLQVLVQENITVLVYGNNFDYRKFAKLFYLKNQISPDEKDYMANIIYIGVKKENNLYVLIRGGTENKDYNFYNCIGQIIFDICHVQR